MLVETHSRYGYVSRDHIRELCYDMAIYLSIIIVYYFKDTHLVGDGFQYQVTLAKPVDKSQKCNREEAQKVVANKSDGLVKASTNIIANKALDYFSLNAKVTHLDAKPMEVCVILLCEKFVFLQLFLDYYQPLVV